MAAAYEKVRVLGRGSFGVAWLARPPDGGGHVVLKEVDTSGMSAAERGAAEQEAKVTYCCCLFVRVVLCCGCCVLRAASVFQEGMLYDQHTPNT